MKKFLLKKLKFFGKFFSISSEHSLQSNAIRKRECKTIYKYSLKFNKKQNEKIKKKLYQRIFYFFS